MIAKHPIDLPPGEAHVYASIDGEIIERKVMLDDGMSAKSKQTRITAPANVLAR